MPLEQNPEHSMLRSIETSHDGETPSPALDAIQDNPPVSDLVGPRDGRRTAEIEKAVTGEASEDRPAGPSTSQEATLRTRERQYALALEERDKRVADLERRYHRALCERELATALAGKPLMPGAADQLLKLWSGEFDVREENGATRIVSRDGNPIAKAVSGWLSSPEYAHFCLPRSRGGTSHPNGIRTSRGSTPATNPRTLGDAVIQQWQESVRGFDDGNGMPIGLHRRR